MVASKHGGRAWLKKIENGHRCWGHYCAGAASSSSNIQAIRWDRRSKREVLDDSLFDFQRRSHVRNVSKMP